MNDLLREFPNRPEAVEAVTKLCDGDLRAARWLLRLLNENGWPILGKENVGLLVAAARRDKDHDREARIIERQEIMWAEMRPDCYGGDECDQIVPGWRCYASGDKGDAEDGILALELAARTFPPGTKVVISEPTCPQCHELRSAQFPLPVEGPIYRGSCTCGFDWDAWVLNEFS